MMKPEIFMNGLTKSGKTWDRTKSGRYFKPIEVGYR